MSTSTRKRTNSPPSFTENATSTTSADLPPSRPRTRPLRKVSPPLSNLGLNNLIYILVLLAALLMAFYSYRIVQYKSQVDGWWNLALGKNPSQLQDHGKSSSTLRGRRWWERTSTSGSGNAGRSDVEHRLNALAEALGIPPKELASAIAGVVKEHVPPASISSMAAKETGQTVKVLLNQDQEATGAPGSDFGLGGMVGTEEPLEA